MQRWGGALCLPQHDDGNDPDEHVDLPVDAYVPAVLEALHSGIRKLNMQSVNAVR